MKNCVNGLNALAGLLVHAGNMLVSDGLTCVQYVHVDAQSGYLGRDGVWDTTSGTTAIGDGDLGRLMSFS